MEQAQNPIERRFEKLLGQWNEFATQEQATVLRWMVKDNEHDLFKAFFSGLTDDIFETPDFWFLLTDAFVDEHQHGYTLHNSMVHYYQNLLKESNNHENLKPWNISTEKYTQNNTKQCVHTCTSFYTLYQEHIALCAVVLWPITVKSIEQYCQWLIQIFQIKSPNNIRFILIDSLEKPQYSVVAHALGSVLKTTVAECSMDEALIEIAASPDDGNTASSAFRSLFVKLLTAVEAHDLKTVEQTTKDAVSCAQEQKWYCHATGVLMAAAGAYLSANQFDKAKSLYEQAKIHAEEGHKNNEPVAGKLIVQVLLAQASVEFSQKHYIPAAALYEKSAHMSKTIKEPLLELDSLRMTGLSYELGKKYDESWMYQKKALAVGQSMDTEKRRHSSLAYVGQSLLRLLKRDDFDMNTSTIHHTMEELLGSQWQEAFVSFGDKKR